MIPADIAKVLEPIKRDVVWLFGSWKLFQQIFLESEDRVELLNKSASGVFVALQDSLRDGIFLGIGRLTDPAQTGGKDNLSLARLGVQVASVAPASLSTLVNSLLNRVDTLSEPFRDWRNRRLAHSDLKTRLNTHSTPLPGVTRSDITVALAAIADVLNAIEKHYDDASTLYDMTVIPGDGDELMNALERSEAHRTCERHEFEVKYGVKRDE